MPNISKIKLPGLDTPYDIHDSQAIHDPATKESGQYLQYDGTSWGAANVDLPDDMTGATATTAGVHGLVPAPAAGNQDKFLKGDGTWGTVDSLPSQTGQSGKFLTTNGTTASWAVPGDMPIVVTSTGTIAAGATTVTVPYVGTYVSSYAINSSNYEVVTERQINAENVVFTINAALSEAITCKVASASVSVPNADQEAY